MHNCLARDNGCAIMQPYFFPYLGYFQLIHAVDTLVFHDDVQFIKGGWIHRNRYLLNGKPRYLTVHLKAFHSADLTKDILHQGVHTKSLRAFENAYSKAPYRDAVLQLMSEVLAGESGLIAELAARSITKTSEYLGLKKCFVKSSEEFPQFSGQECTMKLISICNALQSTRYVNLPGGRALYRREDFKAAGIDLHFLDPGLQPYDQGAEPFVASLSILDVMMHNPPGLIRQFLEQYSLD